MDSLLKLAELHATRECPAVRDTVMTTADAAAETLLKERRKPISLPDVMNHVNSLCILFS